MKFTLKELVSYDAIIFDLGGVILNLDYHKTFLAFKKYIGESDEDVFLGKEKQLSIFSDYEVGKISTTDFIFEFNKYYRVNLDLETFARCWNAMILNIPLERIKLLQKLRSQGKKIFLLSNINEIHEFAVEEQFRTLGLDFSFFSLFNKVYYSHHARMRKPNSDFFELVLRENSLKKESTLFIDDSIQHIHGAGHVGIDAYHLKKTDSLETLGLFLK